ncbi:MAG TPA: GAF domain-containing protein, partial [Fimbriimonas sp.]|nr:GAF domain-containing protein [Fimbriimonas sp.]
MSFGDDLEQLKQQLAASERKVGELEAHIRKLEGDLSRSGQAGKGVAEASLDIAPINEADVTLRRLVQRIAMILQAEKIVIMFYDREQGELIGIPPSYGVDEERLKVFRVRANSGVSGQVFRDGEPIIFHDGNNDPRTQKDPFGLLHAQNGVTVPLVIEKRDEENRVIERNTIGVLHAFNKRHGEDFNDEDVRLLERMARNVGSIIANLQLYREVVEEREELAQTFESLSAGLILVTAEGRLSQMNATARAIFGQSSDAIGKSARDAIRNEQLWALIDEAEKGGEGSK